MVCGGSCCVELVGVRVRVDDVRGFGGIGDVVLLLLRCGKWDDRLRVLAWRAKGNEYPCVPLGSKGGASNIPRPS